MWPDPQETADLVTFTEEILNGKLHFLYSDIKEDKGMLKIVSDGKLLEKEFMVHYKWYREYTRLPKDVTVR